MYLFPYGYILSEAGFKALFWLGASLKNLRDMPEPVRDTFGYALHQSQTGGCHPQAKPLKGFGSAGVLEVVEHAEHGTFRAVYTGRFPGAIYVLHCFQKKSLRGIATPRRDMSVVHERLKTAERHYEDMAGGQGAARKR